MCYNCGCLLPDDDMGHEDNITNHTLEHLAEKMGKSPEETKKLVLQMLINGNITDPDVAEMFLKATKAWGQSLQEAHQNTLELLTEQLKVK